MSSGDSNWPRMNYSKQYDLASVEFAHTVGRKYRPHATRCKNYLPCLSGFPQILIPAQCFAKVSVEDSRIQIRGVHMGPWQNDRNASLGFQLPTNVSPEVCFFPNILVRSWSLRKEVMATPLPQPWRPVAKWLYAIDTCAWHFCSLADEATKRPNIRHRGIGYLDYIDVSQRCHYESGSHDESVWIMITYIRVYNDGLYVWILVLFHLSHFERDLAVGRVKLWRVAFGARQGKQDWLWRVCLPKQQAAFSI